MDGYYQEVTEIPFNLKGSVTPGLIETEVVPLIVQQTNANHYGRHGVNFVGYAHGSPGERTISLTP